MVGQSISQRRQARRLLLQGVYALGDDLIGDLRPRIDATLTQTKEADRPPYAKDLLTELIDGFNTRKEDAMAFLEQQLHIPLEGINLTERIVLILAVVEMLACPQTPKAIVINEWIEVSKEFGSAGGHRLVNAVLDRLSLA